MIIRVHGVWVYKVLGPFMDSVLDRTITFEWLSVVKCGWKNTHRKDTRLKEIGLCVVWLLLTMEHIQFPK